MTVKELREKLNQFSDNLIVMIPTDNTSEFLYFSYAVARNVAQGVNEADGCVFIDSLAEDE